MDSFEETFEKLSLHCFDQKVVYSETSLVL